jgi:hypothetical protein
VIVRLALLAAGVILAASGCVTPEEQARASTTGTPSVAPPPSNPALTSVPDVATAPPGPTSKPPITGSVDPRAIADQASGLSGPARGRMVLAIDGLGQIDSEVTGECVPSPGGTTIRIAAPGSAKVVVALTSSESSVRVTDADLDMAATLLPGDFTVAKPNLTIATTFRPNGGDSPGGRLDLNVTCGG